MNLVVLVGNLGKDPETKMVNNKTVCRLSVATSERYKSGEEWKEETDWHNVIVWGNQADACGKYLAKGKKVGVTGKVRTRSWDDKGTKRYATEIIADRVEFLSPKEEGGGRGAGPANDEIPF